MRKLIRKGTPPEVAITFMLAVPIVNLVAGFLFIGAGISALFRTVIPIAMLGCLESIPGMSTIFMMAVAFVLNLCCVADAMPNGLIVIGADISAVEEDE